MPLGCTGALRKRSRTSGSSASSKEVKTVASKFARAYGKRGLLVAIALITALANARFGWELHMRPEGFFDGG